VDRPRGRAEQLLGDLRGRALWVVLGCLVCQMGPGFGYAMGALAADLLAELGWSRALYSSAQGPQALLIALASPVVGAAVGRYGARAVLSISAVIIAGGYAGVAAMQTWWQFALAWGVIGLGVAGLGDIAVGAAVAAWTVRRRAIALGIAYTGSNLGGAIATRGASEIAGATSWRVAVAVLAATCLALLLPAAWFAVRDRAAESPRADDGVDPALLEEPGLGTAAAMRTRSFWIIAFGLLGFWAYLYALLQHFALALVDAGISREAAAGHWADVVFMGMFSKIAFGLVADRMPPRAAILFDYGLLALSSLLLLAATAAGASAAAVWSFVLLFGFSYAARDVVTPLIVVHCFGSRHLAQIYGVLMLTILPGSNLGGILTGWTHDATGSYAPAFAVLAATNALSFASLFAVRDERRRA
jgi:nitrate/nitrite transporter NarK